jgi:hypothetical protein
VRISRASWCVAIVALLASLTGGAAADPQAAYDKTPESGRAVEEVTVEAQRASLKRRISSYVSRVAIKSPDESVTLWNTPICPLVSGLPAGDRKFVLARLAEIVSTAGAPLAARECQPNFYIMVTKQPESMLNDWYARNSRLFGSAWPAEIKRFIATPRPVRVWYNADLADAEDHLPLKDADAMFPKLSGRDVRFSHPRQATHLEYYETLDLSSVIVVVDAVRVGGLTLRQIADYCVMSGLSRRDLDRDIGDLPTILRLFAATEEPKPVGLSTWDEAFLKALYHTPQKARVQLSEVANRMLLDVTRAQSGN